MVLSGNAVRHSWLLLVFQLEEFMADLLQSWHAGTEAQPLITC